MVVSSCPGVLLFLAEKSMLSSPDNMLAAFAK